MNDFKATITNLKTDKKCEVYQSAPTMAAAIETLQHNNIYRVISITEV
ncbi:MAG: hypothetical protein ACUZ8H_09360 [Candidatus Anammoxibacter sp.]